MMHLCNKQALIQYLKLNSLKKYVAQIERVYSKNYNI